MSILLEINKSITTFKIVNIMSKEKFPANNIKALCKLLFEISLRFLNNSIISLISIASTYSTMASDPS
jgi:hypothetical protein